jgi:hypothetical protein
MNAHKIGYALMPFSTVCMYSSVADRAAFPQTWMSAVTTSGGVTKLFCGVPRGVITISSSLSLV